MFAEPEFWVAVAFVILMAVFAYFGIHRTVLTALDHRSERIKAELDDARRLKEEAAKLLAEYQARRARTAESKIALAEAQALADVRAAAADAAVTAASTILSQSVKGSVADDLLAKGIAEVKAKLN